MWIESSVLLESLAGQLEGKHEGRLEGEARALLRVIDRRGLAIDEATRARVLTCTEAAALDRWLDRAVTASQTSEVFGDELH